MEELKVFENAEFGSVRTTTVNGEIMFVRMWREYLGIAILAKL